MDLSGESVHVMIGQISTDRWLLAYIAIGLQPSKLPSLLINKQMIENDGEPCNADGYFVWRVLWTVRFISNESKSVPLSLTGMVWVRKWQYSALIQFEYLRYKWTSSRR